MSLPLECERRYWTLPSGSPLVGNNPLVQAHVTLDNASSAGALGDRGCLPVGCRAPSVGSMATKVSRDLWGMGAWPPGVLEACGPCPGQGRNILVTGITGAGKTTLLQALARLLPSNEPVLVLDDCEELDLDGPLREFVPLRRGDSAESPRVRQRVPSRGRRGSAGTRRRPPSR